ncbi:pickpocket protein 28-like [Ostrinia furnacalis]|uniref:pickpocket protein 28-like n=1 Tax=Ostrinia furnacalis TaxID=93504 RepID=UPI0010399FB9|nr:pickpocket protein 28-like [Ostrinia furnacalis]
MNKKKKTKQTVFVKSLKKVIEDITTLHGTNHFTNVSGRSVVGWSVVFVGNILFTAIFIIIAKEKYDDNQIVTAIDATCNVSQAPFPAVSICNFNMVSKRESKDIEKLLKSHKIPQAEINGFFGALRSLTSFQVNSTLVGNYTRILNILKHHYYTIDSIMSEVRQQCEDLLLYCEFNRKKKDCKNLFYMIKTADGHCCAFNYGGVTDTSENPLMEKDQDFEYYYDEENDGTGPSTRMMVVTSDFGRLSGLFVIFDVEPGDYPAYLKLPYYGAKIIVSDPFDYPETTTKYHYVIPGESLDLKVEPQIFQTDNAVRKVNPEERKCWFHDEVTLDHTNRYSHETCRTECKMQTYVDHCGCIPYKYPKENSKKICELEDLKCLNNVTVHISRKEMNCHPPCYVECADKKFSMRVDTNTIESDSDNIPDRIKNKYNLRQLSAAHVFYGQSSCNCYKLSLVIDMNYFIATYGGVFSLAFGGSIITVFELLFLLINFVNTNAMYLYERFMKNKISPSH